jgi:hypothetical protein
MYSEHHFPVYIAVASAYQPVFLCITTSNHRENVASNPPQRAPSAPPKSIVSQRLAHPYIKRSDTNRPAIAKQKLTII